MIGYLKGRLIEFTDGRVLVSVGQPEAGLVGYQLSVPQSANYSGFLPGAWLELFVYTHVREDALDLYGFLSRGEKDLFLTLLSVNGIGPKGALGILSKVDPQTLIQAVLDGDKDALIRIPGVGKKTAERVVLELADPLRKKLEAGSFIPAKTVSAEESASLGGAQAMLREAKEGLVGLGFREQEIAAILKKTLQDERPRRAEDLIRLVLKQLS